MQTKTAKKEIEPAFLSSTQTMRLLSVSRSQLYNWVYNRMIPFYRVGKKYLFKEADVREFIETLRFERVDQPC